MNFPKVYAYVQMASLSSNTTPGLSFQPKPYWSTWNQLPEEQKASEPEPTPPMITTDTLPGVPIEVAQRNNMSHQVHTDAPAPYIHRTSAARPMDSLDSPYAVFIFKYRSSGKSSFQKILDINPINLTRHPSNPRKDAQHQIRRARSRRETPSFHSLER